MNNFTSEELSALSAPFPLSAHSVREGYRPYDGALVWFVYIERQEVQDRLDKVFPGEWENPEPHLYTLGKTISAVVGITIRGITRWDGGDDETGEGSKSALTNGFRRVAAYGWHIARYCYDIDIELKTEDYVTFDTQKKAVKKDWQKRKQLEKQAFDIFTTWYNKRFANHQSSEPPKSPSPAPPQVAKQPSTVREWNNNNPASNGIEVNWSLVRDTIRASGYNPDNDNHMKALYPDGTSGKTTEQLIAAISDYRGYGSGSAPHGGKVQGEKLAG